MGKRQRALATVDNVTEWKVFNPVFELNSAEFDEAFSSEYGVAKGYYLEHYIKSSYGDSFEDMMCKNLFSGHGNPDSKLYILKGGVGVGKTSFANYMGLYKLPERYHAVLFLYLNCYKRFPQGATSKYDFEVELKRSIKERVINIDDRNREPWQFQNEAKFAKALAKFRGVTKASAIDAINLLSSASSDVLITFLMSNFNFQKILIVVDNIDDCSEDVKDIAFAFAESLSDCASQVHGGSLPQVSVLVPMRQYTHIATDTEGYPKIDMPLHKVADIIQTKINHAEELINANLGKKFRSKISTDTFVRREITLESGKTKVIHEINLSGKTLQVENVSTLLRLFCKKAAINQTGGMLDFVKSVSSGNLKLVTRNMFNIFHSCKFNIRDIIEYVYTPESSPSYKLLLEKIDVASFGPPLIYDLSMAIHFPFYDVDASFIPNVFNVKNSIDPNDFQNTFGILRVLCFIKNCEVCSYQELQDALASIGYAPRYVDAALSKILDYCLLNSEFGTKTKDLSDSTKLELSSAGKFLIGNSICDHRYLGYVCEDTPMDVGYIVPLDEKYAAGQSTAKSIKKVNEAVDNFLMFLKKEEQRELEYVREHKQIDEQIFLKTFSITSHGKGRMITDHITSQLQYYKGVSIGGHP